MIILAILVVVGPVLLLLALQASLRLAQAQMNLRAAILRIITTGKLTSDGYLVIDDAARQATAAVRAFAAELRRGDFK